MSKTSVGGGQTEGANRRYAPPSANAVSEHEHILIETTSPEATAGPSPLASDGLNGVVTKTRNLTDWYLSLSRGARIPDRTWSADTPLFAAVLAVYSAIDRYLLIRIDLAREVSTARSRRQAPVAEQVARRAINAVVTILRTRGEGPEYVLVRLKEVLATLPRSEYDTWQAVREQVIRWAIESYYAPDLPAESGP